MNKRTIETIVLADHVLTMRSAPTMLSAPKEEIISAGAIAVHEGRILAVGTEAEIRKQYEAHAVIGGAGMVAIPGLVNTHTHAAMVFMRGLADDLPLMQWLEGHIWPAENRWLSEEFVRDAVELACLEMLKAGVTTFCDMYFFASTAADVVKRCGMRAVMTHGVIDFPTSTTTGPDDCLAKAEALVRDFHGDEVIKPGIALHSIYTCSPDTLKKARTLSERIDAFVTIHVAETAWEREESLRRFNRTPVHHLDALGLLQRQMLLAHCVTVSEEEVDVIAQRGASVSHCIESNLKLASGIAPVAHMLKCGVNVSLGTDGAASNNDLDVLGEMATAAKVHKAVTQDPTVLDAMTALRMATCNGARALGYDDLGVLEPGAQADIVLIDTMRPHLSPMYNVPSHLVYAARSSDVHTVMARGRVVVDGGVALTLDEDEVLFKARTWGDRIAGRTPR